MRNNYMLLQQMHKQTRCLEFTVLYFPDKGLWKHKNLYSAEGDPAQIALHMHVKGCRPFPTCSTTSYAIKPSHYIQSLV